MIIQKYFRTRECQDCKFENENDHCEAWSESGYCSEKFVKFMQKKCKQSCCERAELQSVDSERRSGILCDLENNLFNDDITPPPMNEMDEILMNEITCDNFAELKVISNLHYTAVTSVLVYYTRLV